MAKAFPSIMTMQGNYRIAGIIPSEGRDIVFCVSLEEPDKRSVPIPLADFHKADLHPEPGQEYFIAVQFELQEWSKDAGAISVSLTYKGMASISTTPGEPSCVFNGKAA